MLPKQVRSNLKLTLDLLISTGPVSFIVYNVSYYSTTAQELSGSAMANWNMAYISLTLITNIIGTALVIIHIVRVTGVGSRTYAGVIEILVESSLLYTVTYLVYLALFVHDINVSYLSDTAFYPDSMLDAVTVSHYRSISLHAHFILISALPPL